MKYRRPNTQATAAETFSHFLREIYKVYYEKNDSLMVKHQ